MKNIALDNLPDSFDEPPFYVSDTLEKTFSNIYETLCDIKYSMEVLYESINKKRS